MLMPPIDKCLMCNGKIADYMSVNHTLKYFKYYCSIFSHYFVDCSHDKIINYCQIRYNKIKVVFHFDEDYCYFLNGGRASDEIQIPTLNWNDKDKVINKLNSLLIFL